MTTVWVRCRQCGTPVAPDERFCGMCGRERPDPQADPTTPRRAPPESESWRIGREPPVSAPPRATAGVPPRTGPPPPQQGDELRQVAQPSEASPSTARHQRQASPGTRALIAALAIAAVGVVAIAAYRFFLGAPGATLPDTVTTDAGAWIPSTSAADASAPASASGPADAQAPPGFATDVPATVVVPEPDPSGTASPPLVSAEALRWAEENGFDRWRARESLAEGLRHYHGQGVPVDYLRARASFEAAAPYEGRAAYYLAGIYQNGRGVPVDVGLSLQWLHQAAQLGDADAQFALGVSYVDGVAGFLLPDAAQGLRWLTLAARQGHRAANERLAAMGGR